MIESQIKAKIKKHLESLGFQVICLINVAKPGIADLICLKPDKPAFFLEVKQENGKESELQKYRRKEFTDMGYDWIVCFGFEDFLDKVKNVI